MIHLGPEEHFRHPDAPNHAQEGFCKTRDGAYSGQWNGQGYWDGQGRYQNQKHVYCGQFRNGTFHGFGRIDGIGGTYIGDFLEGMRHGFGMHELGDEKYRGYWHEDLPNGEGMRWTKTVSLVNPLWGYYRDGHPIGLHYLSKKNRRNAIPHREFTYRKKREYFKMYVDDKDRDDDGVPYWFLSHESRFIGNALPVLWEGDSAIIVETKPGKLRMKVEPARKGKSTLKIREIGTVHAESSKSSLCVELVQISREIIVFEVESTFRTPVNVALSIEIIPFKKEPYYISKTAVLDTCAQ